MGWNKSTIDALDNAISELASAISNLEDGTLKLSLKKKLKKLNKARRSMTEGKKVVSYYLIMVPVSFLFITLGLFYYLNSRKQ